MSLRIQRANIPFPRPTRLSAWVLALCLPGCGLLSLGGKSDSADASAQTAPPAFSVEVRAPDDVRETLERHLELQRFRHLPDLQAHELQRLLAAAEANARELLGSMGYFAPVIRVELIETPTSKTAARSVVVSVQPGAQARIASAKIDFVQGGGSGASSIDEAEAQASERQQQRLQRDWSLTPGQAFSQSAWDDAKSDGLRQLQSRRHPAARIVDSRAEIDADKQQAHLGVTYDPGPAYRFGPLRIDGSERYDPDGARRLARLPSGAVYDEAEMLDAQLRLASSGYYDSVFLSLDTEAEDPQAAPVTAQLREARLQKLVFGPGFSTDSGPRLTLDHTHNRLPGLGWRALTRLALERRSQSANSEWTALPDEQGWRWFTGGQLLREARDGYAVHSARLRSGRSKSTKHIDRNYFLQYDAAHSQGIGAPAPSSALSANLGWTGRYFNSLTAPTRGHGLALELGLGSSLRPEREVFTRSLLRWQSLIPAGRVQDQHGVGRNARLALRAEAGAVLARAGAQIPVTQLFLTGGDTSVRGYAYHSIGARSGQGRLFGGRYLAVGSVEWQRPIVYDGVMTDWESSLFVDTGAVADRVAQLRPRTGLGAGLRWRSPVGPLQADLAYGLQSRALRLHLRLGYSF